MKGNGRLRIVITGANGMIGRHLTEVFHNAGHQLTLLVRKPNGINRSRTVSLWDPDHGQIEAAALEKQDAVIHLAGKSIAAAHWSEKHKRDILDSRARSTEFLSMTLANLKHPPRVLLSASAIGYYGNRPPAEELDESSPSGEGFMAKVCRQWEEATNPASSKGIRVANIRFGMVLTASGGALAAMLPIFKLGLGGRIGSGRQVMSWIALAEIAPALSHIISRQELSGPLNLVSPKPVTNADFARLLARVLSRPAILAVPAVGAKLAFGEMAEELLLSGARIIPRKLLDSGYQFVSPDLEETFKKLFVR